MRIVRSLFGYRPADVEKHRALLQLEQDRIRELLMMEKAQFEKEMEARRKAAEQIHSELLEALALERRLIEGKESL